MPNPNNERSAKKDFRKSFPALNVPIGGLPRLGCKISDVNSNKLGDIIAQYSAWREYCEDQHLVAMAEFMEVKERYDKALAKQMVLTQAEDVTTKKAIAKTSSVLEKVSKEYMQKEIYAKMLSSKLESFSNSLSMLSRELTRRGIINI